MSIDKITINFHEKSIVICNVGYDEVSEIKEQLSNAEIRRYRYIYDFEKEYASARFVFKDSGAFVLAVTTLNDCNDFERVFIL